ncbi:MAG: hypothetical protein WDW38_005511 [Sanguina aurantia]
MDAVLTQQQSDSPSQVADLWGAHSLAATASKMLCPRTEHVPVSGCYSLPPGAAAPTVFSDLMAAAEASLLAEIGDACAVVRSPALAGAVPVPVPAPARHASAAAKPGDRNGRRGSRTAAAAAAAEQLGRGACGCGLLCRTVG